MQWRMLNRLAERLEDVLGDNRWIAAYAYAGVRFAPGLSKTGFLRLALELRRGLR
jgi:hypothetical protein